MSDDEVRRKLERPSALAKDVASKLVKQLFGLSQVVIHRELASYDDRNYQVRGVLPNKEGNDGSPEYYTLKIQNGVDSDNRILLDCQNDALLLLHKHNIACPYPMPALSDSFISYYELPVVSGESKRLAVRLLQWVHGTPMNEVDVDPLLLEKAGGLLGQISHVMGNFEHPGAHRTFIWDLQQTELILDFVSAIKKSERRELIKAVVKDFQNIAKPTKNTKSETLRMGILQGDFNDANIIVSNKRGMAGVIDFGDIVYSYIINDLAIGMAYTMLSKFGIANPWKATYAFYKGYVKEFPILNCEKNALWTLVACRLAISHTIGMYSFMKNPDNKYLLLHAEPAYTALKAIRSMDNNKLINVLEGKFPTSISNRSHL